LFNKLLFKYGIIINNDFFNIHFHLILNWTRYWYYANFYEKYFSIFTNSFFFLNKNICSRVCFAGRLCHLFFQMKFDSIIMKMCVYSLKIGIFRNTLNISDIPIIFEIASVFHKFHVNLIVKKFHLKISRILKELRKFQATLIFGILRKITFSSSKVGLRG
jgi:hypothetical protein